MSRYLDPLGDWLGDVFTGVFSSEYLFGIIALFFLLKIFFWARRVKSLGFNVWRKGHRNPIQGLLKMGAGTFSVLVLLIIGVVVTLTFTDTEVKQSREVVIESYQEFEETIEYLIWGEEGFSSSYLDEAEEAIKKYDKQNPRWWRYLIAVIYGVFLCWLTINLAFQKKYKTAGIVAFLGVFILTVFRSEILPLDWAAMSFGAWQLIAGVLVIAHGLWRHKVINREMDWNVNPEALEGERGPKKHLLGIWGNALFHICVLAIVGPFSNLVWNIGTPLFWEVLIISATYLTIRACVNRRNKNIAETTSSRTTRSRTKGFKDKASEWWKKRSPVNKVLTVIAIPFVLLVMVVVLSLDLPIAFLFIVALPMTFMIGGIVAPHIRGMLVPTFMKVPIYSRFWLLGVEYITNGIHPTLLPIWLWTFNMILIPYARWELEDIKTDPIPTRDPDSKDYDDESADGGVPVIVLAKALVQCFMPKYWLKMPDSDRAPENIAKVLKRVLLDALRDITRRITYNQAKLQDYYQFQVRRGDLDGYPADHPLRKLYYRRAIMMVKIRSVETWETKIIDDGLGGTREVEHPVEYDGEYVGDDEEGVMIPATCSEYVDWKMLTSTGCRLLELGIIDVSAEGVEKAEEEVAIERRRLKKAAITKQIMKELGEGEGDRQAAQVSRFLNMIIGRKDDDNELGYRDEAAQLAVDNLIRLVGAEKLGTFFQGVEGGSDLLKGLSNMMGSNK